MRQRMKAMAEAEEGGESFWTEVFSDSVRVRVRRVYDRLGGGELGDDGEIFADARRVILDQGGADYLVDSDLHPNHDFASFFRAGPDEMFPTAFEALVGAITRWESPRNVFHPRDYAGQFVTGANEVFAEERVAWTYLDGQMIEMKSQELHASVIQPALRLLHDRRLASVDATYRKALDELSKGDGADAVTDAGAALQELLTALGCTGNQLGDLIRSARQKKLLGAHDTPLIEAIEKAMHWVAADRSQTGESHHASDASSEDAWLIVHVVGAFIVRLASGGERLQP